MAGEGGLLGNSSSPGEDGHMGNSSGSVLAVEQVLVPVLDVLIWVLGVGGHSLVMLILCGRCRQRPGPRGPSSQGTVTGSATDVLLLALSATDLLLLAMLPFHTVAIATQHWPFGDVMCRLVSFLGAACSSASAFTLATLAVTRYLTVVQPARAYRLLTARRVTVATSALWVPACVLAAPQLVFRSVGAPSPARSGTSCFSFLSHREQTAYGVCHFLMTFALPLVVISMAYGGVYRFLWRRRQDGMAPQVERYQRKVTRTSAMLVLAFTLCWLPSYGLMFFLLGGGNPGATGTSPRYGPLSVWARLMATSSTVVNPILYVLMSHKFRQDLLRLLAGRGGVGGAQAEAQDTA
ncbi:galanin receptor type 2-like [Osmerus mordax]|uniref:galanin receptor type 2-like n=1 Tax=Osmerus mordax TaxID=8014 RepID=UPI00350FDA21